jgi:glutathione S-transferase
MSVRPARLYDFPFSGNGYKVRIALAQLGIAIDYEIADFFKGETRTPAFLAMNPMGQIPVLALSDGSYLTESNAILWWLCDGTALTPSDPLERARVIQWMCFEQSNVDKVIGRARFLKTFPDFRPTTQAEWDGWRAEGNQALAVLDGALRGRRFLVSEAYSAADICLYGYVHCADEGGFDLRAYPAVSAWIETVRNQPGHIPI